MYTIVHGTVIYLSNTSNRSTHAVYASPDVMSLDLGKPLHPSAADPAMLSHALGPPGLIASPWTPLLGRWSNDAVFGAQFWCHILTSRPWRWLWNYCLPIKNAISWELSLFQTGCVTFSHLEVWNYQLNHIWRKGDLSCGLFLRIPPHICRSFAIRLI